MFSLGWVVARRALPPQRFYRSCPVASNNERHHRHSIRLRGYDYREAGAYFVTVCTWQRGCLFGEIIDGKMELNGFGECVRDEWHRTAVIRPQVSLNASSCRIMCTELSACTNRRRARHALPLRRRALATRLLDHCRQLSAHSNRPARNESMKSAAHLGHRSGNAIISNT